MEPKIVISTIADQQLEEMLKAVNEGFGSGRVKKVQLASWIINYFRQGVFSKQIAKIRADHFDEIAHLKTVVKQMEEAKKTDDTLELDRLLSPLKGSAARTRKANPVKINEK